MTTDIHDQMQDLGGRSLIIIAAFCAFAISGCGNSSPAATGISPPAATPTDVVPTELSLEFTVRDVAGAAIEGADISFSIGDMQRQARTDPDGQATLAHMPFGFGTLSISADGFESQTWSREFDYPEFFYVVLHQPGDWAVARAILLGTGMVELAGDGSAMTFSIDLAVIDGDAQAIETLTSDDFTILHIDCGWGGPRECASNALGFATGGGGNFRSNGGAQAFGLQPPSARHPYLAGVLAERSPAVTDWDKRAPALKSFFATLGGNDFASLASVQNLSGFSNLAVLGPYTSDGSTYFDSIDQLPAPAGIVPDLQNVLLEWIRQAAQADSGGMRDAEKSVLVMATPEMSVAEIDEATALARASGVHISTISWYPYGLSEMAARTGGFVTGFDDSRQLGMIFGAMDQVLAGTLPYYRMQFHITGNRGTFVSGGNVKGTIKIHVPTPILHAGVYIGFDVAIP